MSLPLNVLLLLLKMHLVERLEPDYVLSKLVLGGFRGLGGRSRLSWFIFKTVRAYHYLTAVLIHTRWAATVRKPSTAGFFRSCYRLHRRNNRKCAGPNNPWLVVIFLFFELDWDIFFDHIALVGVDELEIMLSNKDMIEMTHTLIIISLDRLHH